jgi:tetratricopeptide (TPR) repeat protein
MSRLSAALIVRDESKVIEGCLQSLVGWVDQVVVVDTGSRDDTIPKALGYPIELHHFEWCDDFSAARNFALERASGEWILYIDADERLDAPDPALLDAVLSDRGRVAWNLRFHPRVDWTPYAELRVFRNDPRIRFRGVIHERVQDDIEHVARRDGRTVGDCDLVLRHIGYEDDQTYKNARNIPLLRSHLAVDPRHLYSWWHLGQSLYLAGDEEGARDAWTRGMEAAQASPPSARRRGDALSAEALIKLRLRRGEPVEACLREALALHPDHLVLRWFEATVALERGDLAVATPILEHLAAIDADRFYDPQVSYEKRLFRHLAKEALALCRFRAGRFEEAARLFRSAALVSPDAAGCELKARLAEMRAAETRGQPPAQDGRSRRPMM